MLEEKMNLLLGSSPGPSPEISNNTNETKNIEVPRIEVNNKRFESPQKRSPKSKARTSPKDKNTNQDNDNEEHNEQELKKPELAKTNSKVSLESVLEYWAVDVSEVHKEGMLLGQGHFANVYKGTFRVSTPRLFDSMAVLISCRASKLRSSVSTKRSRTASSSVN